MITTSDLQLISYIVEEGSLTRAADKMYLTQSALSHQLKDLEKRTGMQLFERVNKKLLLTVAGRRIMESAGTILPVLARLNEDLLAIKKGKVHTLRISTECYTCYHWLPGIITRLKALYKDVEIKIVAAATQQPITYMMNGELDLAIVSSKPDNPAIHLNNLFSDNQVAVLPKNHPLYHTRKILTAEDFATENLIVYDLEADANNFMREFFRETAPASISRIQLTEAIIEMIHAGMGVGIFATWVIAPYLQSKQIVTMPLKSPLKKRTWKAAYLDKQNPLIQQFITLAKHHFAPA